MITRADLKDCKAVFMMHARMQGGSLYGYKVDRFPRLTFLDHYDRKSGKTTRTWTVDGESCKDLDAALAKLDTSTIPDTAHTAPRPRGRMDGTGPAPCLPLQTASKGTDSRPSSACGARALDMGARPALGICPRCRVTVELAREHLPGRCVDPACPGLEPV